jgi:hypothetical protein
MIGTLGWTPRVSKKKNEDFVSQKLVKLFPSCWQERKDVAPPCKPARNHNVQIDSLGFAHCRQVLPNYITVSVSLWNCRAFGVHGTNLNQPSRQGLWAQSRVGSDWWPLIFGPLKPTRSNKVRLLPSTGSFSDWSSKDVHMLFPFVHLCKIEKNMYKHWKRILFSFGGPTGLKTWSDVFSKSIRRFSHYSRKHEVFLESISICSPCDKVTCNLFTLCS